MKYVDKKTVVSVAVGVALFGAVVYFAKKSGNAQAASAANVIQGG